MDIIASYIDREVQPDGRIRFWGFVPELPGKALRVVTVEDGQNYSQRISG